MEKSALESGNTLNYLTLDGQRVKITPGYLRRSKKMFETYPPLKTCELYGMKWFNKMLALNSTNIELQP